MAELTYKLELFEGPLDLLLSLIHKNKVNIEDIPIVLIFDQYMEYINEAQRLDLDLASEYRVICMNDEIANLLQSQRVCSCFLIRLSTDQAFRESYFLHDLYLLINL